MDSEKNDIYARKRIIHTFWDDIKFLKKIKFPICSKAYDELYCKLKKSKIKKTNSPFLGAIEFWCRETPIFR